MPIVFEEISAEIAPPQDAAGAASQPPPPPGEAADPLETLRHALALLGERALRLVAD